MKPVSIMLIAGEASSDMLAAQLVTALREKVVARSMDAAADAQPLKTALAPQFFGAGGPKMAAAGVELAFDLTQHSVFGYSEVFKNIAKFRRMFWQLFDLALERRPDVIIGVDYGGFNLRFAKAIRSYVRRNRGQFNNWNPKIVQFVSPAVWASRPGRAYTIAENHDLLLSIFPFEKAWYAKRVPKLRVEFVGHPMVGGEKKEECGLTKDDDARQVVLLPGSRAGEVQRHLPLIVEVFERLRRDVPALTGTIILPNEKLAGTLQGVALPQGLTHQIGGLESALGSCDLAITKSGTVTMECAFAGVPAVVFYKLSGLTYLAAKLLVNVKWIAMPNLLVDNEVYPEFIQHGATAESIARVGLELLRNETLRAEVKLKLARAVESLGGPGAAGRAADAVVRLLV